MLQVIQRNPPAYWEEVDYKGKLFVLKEVSSSSPEYIKCFENCGVKEPGTAYKLYRVQNPFAYGRFALWKEQQTFRGQEHQRQFHKSNHSSVDRCIEHNYDPRKTSRSPYDFLTSYVFSLSFLDSDVFPLSFCDDDVIHVLLVIPNSQKETNKNLYSEYVITKKDLINTHVIALPPHPTELEV